VSVETPLDHLVQGLPVVQQLQRIEERLLDNPPDHTYAVWLEGLTPGEAWQQEVLTALEADRLTATTAVVVLTRNTAERERITAALRQDSDTDPPGAWVIRYRETASLAILHVVSGHWRELYVPSSRGEGKTFLGLGAWVLAGWRHRLSGQPRPMRVAAFSGTFTMQKAKLVESALRHEWGGLWRSLDDDHLLRAVIEGTPLVDLMVTGVDGPNDLDKLRAEFTSGWAEEVEAAGEEAVAVPERAVEIVQTSLGERMPGPVHTVLVTANYGSETGWPWRRYVLDPVPASLMLRIPCEERATPEDRARWAEQLRGDPAMKRRLVDGLPALIVQGEAVLQGIYDEATHVSRSPLAYVPGCRLYLGHDAGLTPVTVVLQAHGPTLEVLAALVSTRAGTEQHLTDLLIPWLEVNAPDAEVEHWCDPSMMTPTQADLTMSPAQVIRRRLGGPVREGPVRWEQRRDPLVNLLGQIRGGRPALLIHPGPETEVLRRALAGAWHFPKDRQGRVMTDLPVKDHPASDVADALCYAIAGAKPWRQRAAGTGPRAPIRARMSVSWEQPRRDVPIPSDMQGARIIRTPNTWR
jgi:hypothetical protein